MSDPTLRWRLRRGMKELDIVFARYYARRFESASEAERAAFERMLDREDPEIWRWVMGQAPVPAEFDDVITKLRIYD